ncbi:helix-turn-helix domain-containing protein [Enterococcus timonensis]|uniref:helix-turn-helix domain-containing protein n=1 Tax=Enterococcus timonensis TaxID=1852364 RepID=UPI0008D9F901|nr:helix-turn-helix transcriptional regulator [Enterococcus timonensis]
MVPFKVRLQKLTSLRGWSQAELSRQSKISPQQISYYMNGDREPSKDNLKKLAKVFNIQTEFFLTDIVSEEVMDDYIEFGIYEGYEESPSIEVGDTPEFFQIQRKSKKLNQKDQKRLLKIMEATFDDIDNGSFKEDNDDDDL